MKSERRRTLQKYAKERLTRHTGTDKDKKTVYDIIELLFDPSVKLPTFVAMHLERLPPVDAEHVDVSAILQELTFILRSEIKSVAQLREEITELRSFMESDRGRSASSASMSQTCTS